MAREHIRAFAAYPEVKIGGIYSRTETRAKALADEYGIAHVCTSIEDLFAKTHADLVIVTVPELAARTTAEACFQFPWTVLMEKPAGYDLADAEKIEAAAKASGSKVYVGFNRRFYDSVLQTRAGLAELPSDTLRFIHIQDQQSYAEARSHNHPETVVEKFMYANSIHVIDMIRSFARGAVKSVESILPWEGEKTHVMASLITFDSGDKAIYEGIWQGPGPWACSVSTPLKRFEMRPLETVSSVPAGQRRLTAHEIDSVDTQYKAGFYHQAGAVLNAIKNGKANAPLADMADSLITMRLINQMFGV